MREGWKKVNLDNSVVDIIDGDRGSNYPKQDEFFDKGYCLFLNTGNVTVNGFNFEKTQFVTKEKDDLLRKGKLRRNDIVLTTRGTVGNVAYYDDSVPFDNVRINSGMVVLRIDSEQRELYTRYFYHFLKSALFKEQVLSHASGSAQPQLPIKDMKQIELTLPPFETQRRIATILSALDDKIELNRQTNLTLKAIAQALFKEWFVDFSFPGATGEMQESELGPIPVGWKVRKLGDVCDVNKNALSKNDELKWIEYIEISGVDKGVVSGTTRYDLGKEPSRAKRKINHGDTVLSTVRPDRGSFFLAINPPSSHIASTGFAVFSATKVPFTFLYIFLTDLEKLEYYGHIADGGAYPAINPNLIMDMDIIIPDEIVLHDFHSRAKSIFEKMHIYNQQSKQLSQLRDTLLPKLMNGDIAV